MSNEYGSLQWDYSSSSDVIGYYLYIERDIEPSSSSFRINMGKAKKFDLFLLIGLGYTGEVKLAVAPYDDAGNIGDFVKANIYLKEKLDSNVIDTQGYSTTVWIDPNIDNLKPLPRVIPVNISTYTYNKFSDQTNSTEVYGFNSSKKDEILDHRIYEVPISRYG